MSEQNNEKKRQRSSFSMMNFFNSNDNTEINVEESKSQPGSYGTYFPVFLKQTERMWTEKKITEIDSYYKHNQVTKNKTSGIGIVHQFENNKFFNKNFQPGSLMENPWKSKHKNLNGPSYIKCSCCRNCKSELICGPCSSTKILKLATIREHRRALFLHKAQLCLAIEKHLEDEVCRFTCIKIF